MTGADFNKWYDHFKAAFPAVDDFVRKADKTGEATKALWLSVLKKRDLADALAVTNNLFEGTTPIPWLDKGFHDWSSVPRHISRLCAELHPVVPEWQKHTYRDRSTVRLIDSDESMAAAYKHCTQEILDKGGTMDDVRAYLDELYGCKQSPAAARDKGNYEPAFDTFNQS